VKDFHNPDETVKADDSNYPWSKQDLLEMLASGDRTRMTYFFRSFQAWVDRGMSAPVGAN